ncbi:MAG: hypothetical protein WBC92_08035 [Terracidiphilus sp.]
MTRRTIMPRGSEWICVLAFFAVFLAAGVSRGQSAPASGQAPATAPADENRPTQRTAQSGQAPVLNTPPVAIVPLDKSIPGAALSVAGPLQAWNGRAYLTSNGTVTAGDGTAQVTLPYRGTLHVCASSTVKLAADANSPAGQIPGLLIALDHGAVEMSFAASAARERNADTLLTPYFRILIGGPSATDLKVRLGDDGDTCVDNAGTDAPYVVVTSVFDGGVYRVLPGQRVMFEHGSLHQVVDQEKEPCGCPPSPKAEVNEFPLAQSEGFTPVPKTPASGIKRPAGNDEAATTLVYNSGEQAQQMVTIPRPTDAPVVVAPATPAAKVTGAQKKPGFFRRVGRFFKRVFGAD